jgi:hypothetical protein
MAVVPTFISALISVPRQGGPDLAWVALAAVLALSIVACQDFLTELIRTLKGIFIQTERGNRVRVDFKDAPPPEASPDPKDDQAKPKAHPGKGKAPPLKSGQAKPKAHPGKGKPTPPPKL